jgi:hypothetical protein
VIGRSYARIDIQWKEALLLHVQVGLSRGLRKQELVCFPIWVESAGPQRVRTSCCEAGDETAIRNGTRKEAQSRAAVFTERPGRRVIRKLKRE